MPKVKSNKRKRNSPDINLEPTSENIGSKQVRGGSPYARRPIRASVPQKPGIFSTFYSFLSNKVQSLKEIVGMGPSRNPAFQRQRITNGQDFHGFGVSTPKDLTAGGQTSKASKATPFKIFVNPKPGQTMQSKSEKYIFDGDDVDVEFISNPVRAKKFFKHTTMDKANEAKPSPDNRPKFGRITYPFWKQGARELLKRQKNPGRTRKNTALDSIRLDEKESYRQMILLNQRGTKLGLNDSFIKRFKENSISKRRPSPKAFTRIELPAATSKKIVDNFRKDRKSNLVLPPWQRKITEYQQSFKESPEVTVESSSKIKSDSPIFLGQNKATTSFRSPKPNFSVKRDVIWTPGVIDLVDDDDDEIEFVEEVPRQKKTFSRNVLGSKSYNVAPPKVQISSSFESPYRRHSTSSSEALIPSEPSWIEGLKQSIFHDCKAVSSKIEEREKEVQRLEEKRCERIRADNRKAIEGLKRMVIDDSESEVDEDDLKLPPITPEMRVKIDSAMKPNPPDEILVKGHGLQITRRDIETLSNLNWLNDEVINYYFALIVERGKHDNFPSCYAFNTFFYPRLMDKGHSGIKRWTKKVDIFSYNLILIPVHLGLHWCLAVIDFRQKKIMYYDSMGGQNNECLNALKQYLQDESRDKRGSEFDTSSWKLEPVKNIPQQMNGSDCGMFALKYAEYITRNAKITFTQTDMPYFRKRTVYEIVINNIL